MNGVLLTAARSFGPAVVSGVFTDQWIFWVGPFSGAVIAALLYELLFRPSGPIVSSLQLLLTLPTHAKLSHIRRLHVCATTGASQLLCKDGWKLVRSYQGSQPYAAYAAMQHSTHTLHPA